MIVRAVSSSESESDDHDGQGVSLHGNSVFGADVPPRPTLSVHVAKRVWISATLALIALVFVDLAALTSSFASTSGAATRDPFALMPVLLDAYATSITSLAADVSSATALNNVVGLVGVAAWIFSRESSARSRHSSSSGFRTLRSPYTLVAGVLCFGHVVSCLYVLLALIESNGDRKRFFLGAARSSGGRRASPYV